MAVTGVEAKLTEALLWFAGQIVTSPPLKIANPNVDFTPDRDTRSKTGGPYLAVTILPNTADVFGTEFDGDVDFQGLIQVSVFWPSGQGLVKPLQVASQVAAAFAPGTRIDRNGMRIRIDRKPIVSGALVETDWCQVPVTSRWRAFVPATA